MQILKIQFLKSKLKNKNFSHMSRKVRFQIRYDPNNKKICSSAVSNSSQKNSLSIGIINYLINYFTLINYISKETMVKN